MGVHTHGAANRRRWVVAAPYTEASSSGMGRRNWNRVRWKPYVGL